MSAMASLAVRSALLALGAALALAQCVPALAKAPDPIQSAESAAPREIAAKATILAMNADGSTKLLRKGSNNFTCLPDNPATPGPDPMCADAKAMEWIGQWVARKPPNRNKPGFIYMLAGGTDASNTDPWAKNPSDGHDWVPTGPHVMLVGIGPETLAGYPTANRPDTRAGYVMWAGTPYARQIHRQSGPLLPPTLG
jgi:hypothetical protein